MVTATNSLLERVRENRAKVKNNPTDWNDQYDALESAMFNVKEIIDVLTGIPEFEDWKLTMEDVLDEMKSAFEPLEARASYEYAQEIAALTRDYYRSVL